MKIRIRIRIRSNEISRFVFGFGFAMAWGLRFGLRFVFDFFPILGSIMNSNSLASIFLIRIRIRIRYRQILRFEFGFVFGFLKKLDSYSDSVRPESESYQNLWFANHMIRPSLTITDYGSFRLIWDLIFLTYSEFYWLAEPKIYFYWPKLTSREPKLI